MAYQIEPGEALSAAVRRIAREEFDDSLAHLRRVMAEGEAGDGERSAAIHQARKSWKKLRGLVRLVRAPLGEETYRRENATFRDAGRRLSPVRDAQVLEATLAGLVAPEDADDGASYGADVLRNELHRHRQETVVALLEVTGTVEEVIAELEAVRPRIAGWTIGEGWESVEPGIARTYRRGRGALEEARRAPTVESLHDWRKRVKYRWYQVRLLAPLWSKVLVAEGDELDELGDRLGDDHDLATLLAFVRDREPLRRKLGEERVARLSRRVEERRAELQRAAWALGSRLYAEKPKRFVARLASYWEAADRP